MGVEFHCSKCGKQIRAPREAAGQRGKCPYCEQSVYIPTPEDELEPLGIAPLDATPVEDDPEYDRMVAGLGNDDTGSPIPEGKGKGRPASGGGAPVDVPKVTLRALKCLMEARGDDADEEIAKLKRDKKAAKEHLQDLMMDELPPPELGTCPSPVYKGFLKKIIQGL